ncbi:MAG: CheR family methyltransferase [Fusobacteriota bacterium]
MNRNKLSKEQFNLFSDYIFKKAGINYPEKKLIILQNRIRRRLRDLKIDSYEEYYKLIKNKGINDPEVIKFFDAITTNETSFFRHDKQFEALEEMIIPEIIKNKRQKKLNIWSAAASMGKEAYSIAMVLKAMPELSRYNIKILGTDLNSKVLRMAKQGEYNIKDIKEVPDKYLKHIKKYKDKEIIAVDKKLKSLIEFKRFNLQDSFSKIPQMDIIFCRNVFIYFTKDTQKQIVDKFYEKLNPGGFFVLGHSETLNGISDKFKYRKHKKRNLMIYQK